MKGALSLAECKPEYKVDCTLILNNGRDKKDFILRIAFDSVEDWKAKNADVPVSPLQGGRMLSKRKR